MEMDSIQRISWHETARGAVLWVVNGVVDGAMSAVSKTARAWDSTPKALKLPLETAVILSGEWSKTTGGLAAFTVLTETPRTLAAFLSNQPIKCFGERWQLVGSSFPVDPKAPLTELDQKIGAFDRAQPLLAIDPLPKPPESLDPLDSSPLPISDMEKTTDRNLEILIEKVSYISILKAMHAYSGISDANSTNIFNLVDEASRSDKPSLWNIYISHYGDKIGFWGRLKAGFLYVCLWKAPIIPKAVDAYLKNMLAELRINLKENGEKRKKFINGLLEDADNFLEVYNGAAETYANDNARKGNLNHYRKNAVNLMLPREDVPLQKTPEELRMDFYRKLSFSIIDHFAPDVRFGFLDPLLNRWIKKILREIVLPQVFLSISDEGKEAMQQYNIPFYLALTRTLTAQVAKIQGKLDQGSSDESSFTGIKNFESIVKKFLRSIDMADCKTVEEVRLKIEKLKQPETGIDADVRSGIQQGIQRGMAVLFDYLSKQENTEELFANLFESVTYPLSGGNLPMTDRQWAEIAVEYEGAKILLKQSASSLAKQVVQESVQDRVRGGSIPEQIEKSALKIFSEHRARSLEAYEELCFSCQALQDKIKQSKNDASDETSILPELGSMASVLKIFENRERVKITMEQDPPPAIALLPNAEQEAILRVLHPIYEGSNQIMNGILRLQDLQKKYTVESQVERTFKQIKQAFEEIASTGSPAASLVQMTLIQEYFTRITELSPPLRSKLWPLQEEILSISETLGRIDRDQKSLDALSTLQSFPNGTDSPPGLLDQLLLCIEGTPPPGFKKWQCIEQIKENVAAAAFKAEEEQQFFLLLEKINKYNSLPEPRPDFNQEIWNPLSALLDGHKQSLEAKQKQLSRQLERSVPIAHRNIGRQEEKTHRSSQAVWQEMHAQGNRLQEDVSKLYSTIEAAKKEILLHPSAAQLGQIGGTLGFLFGLGAGMVYPEIGGTLGAVAAASVANLGNLAKQKWMAFALPVLGAGAAAGIATNRAVSLAPASMPYLPALISGAGASAGFEYVGSKMTKQLIDTGVEIAIPKVVEIFDKGYEHLLTNDIVINGGLKIVMKQVVDLFPPKK